MALACFLTSTRFQEGRTEMLIPVQARARPPYGAINSIWTLLNGASSSLPRRQGEWMG